MLDLKNDPCTELRSINSVFLIFLFQFILILPIHFYSVLEGVLDTADFLREWNHFRQSHDVNDHQVGTQAYQDYEFQLLDEFSDQQAVRYRPYIPTIDRHKDCRPYSDNKITLLDGTEMSASFVQLTHANSPHFIATQAPFQHNVHLFWQMVAENQIDQIVMVTELFDIHQPLRELAYPYWPQKVGETSILGNGLEITLIEEYTLLPELKEHVQVRKFNLCYQGKDRLITHYWYRNWVDDTAPDQFQTIFTLIDHVEEHKNLLKHDSPILVHCSAGVGRTGVFVTLYHLMQHVKGNDQQFNLFDFIAYLRWQRPYLVATLSQYKFCYEANAVRQQIGKK